MEAVAFASWKISPLRIDTVRRTGNFHGRKYLVFPNAPLLCISEIVRGLQMLVTWLVHMQWLFREYYFCGRVQPRI